LGFPRDFEVGIPKLRIKIQIPPHRKSETAQPPPPSTWEERVRFSLKYFLLHPATGERQVSLTLFFVIIADTIEGIEEGYEKVLAKATIGAVCEREFP
jgi:hypothetical protein